VLTAAGASHKVAEDLAPSLPDGVVYADFTSSAPAAKLALQDRLAGVRDVQLVDVAILGPVVKLGATTPLMVAGPGSNTVAQIMRPLGAPIEAVDGEVGAAMAHKLLRSVFMKGLAATVVEAVEAGRAAGFEPWIREQIARELAGDGQATINRFESGSRLHGARRASEMDAAAGYLQALGVSSTMTTAAAVRHRELVAPEGTHGAA
jgi:3-hydroxyisobutyrate dehydrogenase-like beta-hydroxyacid dehydrogenase